MWGLRWRSQHNNLSSLVLYILCPSDRYGGYKKKDVFLSNSRYEMVRLVRLISMLSVTDLFQAIQPQDCFTSVDLHDAYFHVLIAPEHSFILCVALQGQAFQFYVLPFSLSVALFMKMQTTHCLMSFTESTGSVWASAQLAKCTAFAPLSLLWMTLQCIH